MNVLALGLLLILWVLLICGAQQTSVTADEMAHVAAGYAFLTAGRDADWIASFHITPCLLNVLVAVPIYIVDRSLPIREMAGWEVWWRSWVEDFASHVFGMERAPIGWHLSDSISKVKAFQPFFATRVPTMLLTIVLGALVYRWGKVWIGSQVGLVGLFFLVFDPTLLGHGRLATTDVGVTTFGTAALYEAWRWLEDCAWRRALTVGFLLGLTMLAKASGGLWAIAVVLMLIVGAENRERLIRMFEQGVICGFIAILAIWAAYGFAWGRLQGTSIPIFAPAYWEAFLAQVRRGGVHWAFALGMRRQGHWWWYFPFAFFIKNPLPLLMAFLLGAASCRRLCLLRKNLALAVFPLLYLGAALLWGVNIGYRYMLAIHPFLYLLAAAAYQGKWRRWQQGVLVVLLVWAPLEIIAVFPNEIAYFNELVGGSRKGYLYLSDSNTEWGQSMELLYAYHQAHPEVLITPPSQRLLPPPGRYIINASHLQGINIDDIYAYEWFRHREPTSWLNETLLIYDVPPHEVKWFAQCSIPAPPLTQEHLISETGITDLRNTVYDCLQTWIYPSGGTESGIYILHHSLFAERSICLPNFCRCEPVPKDPFIARHTGSARLSFEHEIPDHQWPAFLAFEMPKVTVTPPGQSRAYAAPAVVPPSTLISSGWVNLPLYIDGPLVFLGASTYWLNNTVEIETWWKVTEGPVNRPFSIMAHLLDSSGNAVGIQDGLGVSPLLIHPGDIVVQRHQFTHVSREPTLWFRTGVYWLDTMERMQILSTADADAIYIMP